MFANRLRKNQRHLRRWAAREGVTCYRVYDADIPEYSLAVDLYERWAHVQEYEPPATVDPRRATERLQEALAAVPAVLGIPPENVFSKIRRRQRGRLQYEKLADKGRFYEVAEGGLRFLVNFTDYLDTGLFLDHRPTRELLRALAAGSRFLNLFGYTGTATVFAAAGGAVTTTTVDLSQTYLTWAGRNLELNGYAGASHSLVRADVLRWLEEHEGEYDLIFLDPPTFSTSKGMSATFDVQRDHVPLLRAALRLLAPGGSLVFSNNFKRFRLDHEGLGELEPAALEIKDLTAQTIPPDFARNPRIHNTWLLRRGAV
jgi:23S rRNA (guanine2445-N2)-methyltransferase / 23S rRNA (guanine2069-N7)-methyltransferase